MRSTALKMDPNVLTERYKCDITESWVIVEGGMCVKMYGLHLYNECPFLAKQKGESCRVDNISDEYEEVCALKRVIEEMDVYPVHLKDILEDYFS